MTPMRVPWENISLFDLELAPNVRSSKAALIPQVQLIRVIHIELSFSITAYNGMAIEQVLAANR